MPRASESQNELRCANCDKCLAVDGEIRCRGCKTDNKIPGYAMQVATHAMGHAILHSILRPEDKPVAITVRPADTALGCYASYSLETSGAPAFASREDMRKRLVIHLGTCLVVEKMGGATQFTEFARAAELAQKIVTECDGKPNDFQAAHLLLLECQGEAIKLVNESSLAKVRQLSEILAEHGTMTGEQFEGVMKQAL